ncbi:MAG: PAS domain-containing protein [Actinomycetota bacterium]
MTEPAPPHQRHIGLILARDFAATVSTPIFVVDEEGDLVYFNEAAESVLGRPFAETQMSAEEWAIAFTPVDEDGGAVPLEELPLGIAFMTGKPAHRPLSIVSADGVERDVEVTAFPIYAPDHHLVGGVAVFWER